MHFKTESTGTMTDYLGEAFKAEPPNLQIHRANVVSPDVTTADEIIAAEQANARSAKARSAEAKAGKGGGTGSSGSTLAMGE